MNVLIADDAPESRKLLELYLRRLGHTPRVAGDGQEAWEMLEREPVGIVISDWMMPRLDGIELCRRIRAASFPRYVYVMLLTARDKQQDVVAGMEAGADDFIFKPVTQDMLRARLRAADRILGLEAELGERNRRLVEKGAELEDALGRIRKDLRAASALQRGFLPPPAPSLQGVELDWLFVPSSFVAGDIFNYFPLDASHLGLYLLDVAGHGVPSALLSVSLGQVLTPLALGGDPRLAAAAAPGRMTPPSQALRQLNERFQFSDESMMFFTIGYGVLDTARRELELALAGHPPPILLREGVVAPLACESGLPVGMFPAGEWPASRVALRPGDRLFFYSDGVVECAAPDGEPFSEQRLCEHLSAHKGAPLGETLRALEAALTAWRGGDQFDDDISVLALRIAA